MPALVYPHPAAAPVLRPLVGMVKLLLFQQHHVVTLMGADPQHGSVGLCPALLWTLPLLLRW